MPVLSTFLQALFTTGEVVLKATLCDFDPEDRQEALKILEQAYGQSLLEMPPNVPTFDGEAAIWGATTLYKLLQFAMIRALDAAEMNVHLKPYEGVVSVDAIYSVDLCLRHLPEVQQFAKALAPDDPLVLKIDDIAASWPYSSVGVKLDGAVEDDMISSNKALRIKYIDRIIERKDQKRLANQAVKEQVEAAFGQFQTTLWPGYELTIVTN